MHSLSYLDYDDYEEMSRYFVPDRKAHRQRKELRKPRTRRQSEVPQWIAEQIIGEDEFTPSFACSDNEQALLRDALGGFYHDHIVSDVLARVKGGKEANVYCCLAHPATKVDLLAAKIYRPKAHRTMRNDAVYREGRLMLDQDGKEIVRGARERRALRKKTDFGKIVETFSWIEHEYDMLETLYAAGADVPRPLAHVGNTILMAYFGQINNPAPTLNSVKLDSAEAKPMFDRLMWHVELMLSHNRIHGDLSPYNVLYWEGRAVVIDFPQAVVALRNRSAYDLLKRDIQRLCQYFTPYGIEADHQALTQDLWTRFLSADL